MRWAQADKRKRQSAAIVEKLTEDGWRYRHFQIGSPCGVGQVVGSCTSALVPFSVQRRIALSESAMTIAATTVTRPGSMKLWLSRYFPILVDPV